MPKLVYDFTEGNKDLKDLLGGKGANLAEMTNLGLPVPARVRDHHRRLPLLPAAAARSRTASPRRSASTWPQLEDQMGRKLGDHADPLLVSVRSGAKFSMPGMMETVLNIGLSDESVHGLAKQAGSERFAWDSYRRLIQMFGKTVLGIEGEALRARHRRGQAGQGHARTTWTWTPATCRRLVDDLQGHRPRAHRPGLPAGAARADGPGRQRRVQLVERRPGHPVPPPGAHPDRPRHRGQHRDDGVRQPGHGLGHRRRLHPRPGHRPAGRLRRLPAERPGRGRRRGHPQHGAAAGPGADRPEVLRTS